MPSVVVLLRRGEDERPPPPPPSSPPPPAPTAVVTEEEEAPPPPPQQQQARRRRRRRGRRHRQHRAAEKEDVDDNNNNNHHRLFVLPSPSEAPLLVGAKGRTIRLVRSQSGLHLTLRGLEVFATAGSGRRRRAPVVAADPLLARQMGVSASAGGVLRWFVSAQAAREGYPPHMADPLEALAEAHRCDLRLLPGQRGHVCLMLVPSSAAAGSSGSIGTAGVVAVQTEEEEENEEWRARVREARAALLPRLAPFLLLRHRREQHPPAHRPPSVQPPPPDDDATTTTTTTSS
jgi:hypothetical protein